MSEQYSLVLCHHGVKGMKRGQRKDSYYKSANSARGLSRQLNQYDKARTKTTSQYIKNDLKSRKIAKKADNYFNKIDRKKGYDDGDYRVTPLSGKDKKRIGKLMDKAQQYDIKAKPFNEIASRNSARASALIADSKIKGYSVNSKDVLRYANKGKRTVIAMSGVGITAIRNRNRHNIEKAGDRYQTTYNNRKFNQNLDVTVGTKYKVKDTSTSKNIDENIVNKKIRC